ncbi:SCO family protein [Sneathiella limimaris]|uniref:SCO family protein n=1 Tax=Sneathiella limimaris TaxID=1964213 RepID=UPI00146E37F7|nr:SCO family protein [Sneathiella limimaris]
MNKIFAYVVGALVVVGIVIAVFVISNELFGDKTGGRSGIIAGAPQIGGPFTLTNQDGQQVTDEDYKGKLMLVFFGYTFCPDVCPTELNVMAQVMQQLGDQGKDVAPVFITVDPERDTVEVLKDYVSAFHPSIIGLTGTQEQIAAVKKHYRAYGQAVDKEKDPDFYLVDHTSFTYLMGRDGSLQTVFSYGTQPEEIVKTIKETL